MGTTKQAIGHVPQLSLLRVLNDGVQDSLLVHLELGSRAAAPNTVAVSQAPGALAPGLRGAYPLGTSLMKV